MGTPVSTPSTNGSHPRAVAEAGLGLRGAPGIEPWAEEERRFPWRRLALKAGAVLVLVAIGIVTAQRLLAPAPAPLAPAAQVVAVQRTTVASTVSATGSVAANLEAELSFRTSGSVAGIDIKVGDHVTTCQALAALSSDTQQGA
jgi:multidrug efflux pump subunit AcrA (membrane-fusion protein)